MSWPKRYVGYIIYWPSYRYHVNFNWQFIISCKIFENIRRKYCQEQQEKLGLFTQIHQV